ALQVCQNPTAMPFVIGGGTWIAIDHSKSQRIVEKDSNLTCRRRYGFLFPDTPCQPPVECAKGSVASPERGCG
ncbi:hypothetical protein SB759_35990, partial [Pseudomonas sp. SIMBA_059]